MEDSYLAVVVGQGKTGQASAISKASIYLSIPHLCSYLLLKLRGQYDIHIMRSIAYIAFYRGAD